MDRGSGDGKDAARFAGTADAVLDFAAAQRGAAIRKRRYLIQRIGVKARYPRNPAILVR